MGRSRATASGALGVKKIQDPAFCFQDDSCTHVGYWCVSAQGTEEVTTLHKAKPNADTCWNVSYKMELQELRVKSNLWHIGTKGHNVIDPAFITSYVRS